MKIGINFEAYGGLPIEETVRLLKSNGFATSFVMADNAEFESIMPLLDKNSIECETLHAPFYGINSIWLKGSDGDEMLKRLLASVDGCVKYGVPILVAHLSSGVNPPPISDIGIERFDRLMSYADEKSVTVAFENQRLLGNIAFAFERYANAGFCWDVGHEKCFANGREYMPLFGQKTVAVHIHDNLFEQNGDKHLLPFDGKIDYNTVVDYLAKSPYKKSVMLEVIRKNSNFYDAYSPELYFEKAAVAARKIAQMLNL